MTGEQKEIIKMIREKHGDEYLVRLLAEECTELAQAALKWVRARHTGETPVSRMASEACMVMEIADVLNCIDTVSEFVLDEMNRTMIDTERDRKMKRWFRRMKEA